jgi:hypothetical protein
MYTIVKCTVSSINTGIFKVYPKKDRIYLGGRDNILAISSIFNKNVRDLPSSTMVSITLFNSIIISYAVDCKLT